MQSRELFTAGMSATEPSKPTSVHQPSVHCAGSVVTPSLQLLTHLAAVASVIRLSLQEPAAVAGGVSGLHKANEGIQDTQESRKRKATGQRVAEEMKHMKRKRRGEGRLQKKTPTHEKGRK